MTKTKDQRAKEKTAWMKQAGVVNPKLDIRINPEVLQWICPGCGCINDIEERKCFTCGEPHD